MRIIKVTPDWIDKTSVLFNRYRKFYGQEDDIQTSTEFVKNRVSNNESTIFLALDEKK